MRHEYLLGVSTAALLFCACSDEPNQTPDGGAQRCSNPVLGGANLQDFCPPDTPGPKSVLFAASGEVLAAAGYDFPPGPDQEIFFVDGWEVRYAHAIVVFDHVTLSENPDKVPTDQSKTDEVIAEVTGPWAVDLHLGGSLEGKGGGDERAAPVAAVSVQNKKGDIAFDTTLRYAFGFKTIAATEQARNVNLDAEGQTLYREMIDAGYTVMLTGTARFNGTTCTSSVSTYDFSALPQTVNFKFGLKIPSTYTNCQNPENSGTAFAGEEFQRGISIKENTYTFAQVTFHLDHGYWESVEHDSPAHFDQFAATKVGASGTPTVTIADLVGVDFTAFRDSAGHDLPWRTCSPDYTPTGNGTMGFDAKTIPVNPGGEPNVALRDYADYVGYNLSSYGHLNSDGLCAFTHDYASPQ